MSKQQENAYKYAKTKKRYWTFVLYPESAPENWRDLIQQTGLLTAISPLHDKDIDPTGEAKKPHHHIILCYEGPTTGNNVKAFVDELNQPMPLPIDSVRGLYRYFTHKDNPDKYQYNESDITTINGFNINDFSNLSSSETTAIKLELTKFARESDVYEYADFMNRILDLDKPDYFLIASTNTLYFNAYLTSKRNKLKDGIDSKRIKLVDTETGEVY